MAQLQYPNESAGFLVDIREDGSALRNDGVELTPASQNPWYVLATVYGEFEDGYDAELAAKNRRIWNGWACARKPEKVRAEFAKKLKLPVSHLADLSVAEKRDLDDAFQSRLPESNGIPEVNEKIHFSHTHLSNTLVLDSCVFCQDVNFQETTFSGYAYFRRTLFLRRASFESAAFGKVNFFHSAVFNGLTSFVSATFAGLTMFSSAKFKWTAKFNGAVFDGRLDFASTRLSKSASFKSTVFNGPADFSNGALRGKTVFFGSKFHGDVPKFYQRTLHQDTEFTTKEANWPTLTAENASDSKRAYTRLRQMMSELHKPDDEHFFFRQEMRCELLLEDWWNRWPIRIYGWLSDYGYSVMRPTAWLAGVVAFGWAIIGPFLRHGQANPQTSSIWEGLGVSISNTFPFLGFGRKMHPDFFKQAPARLDALSAGQSILGIILLFFLGLGLRNRFRIK